MLKDVRHAVRVLLHAKGWTAVVLLSLALGIGANTAIFSAVNGLLLKHVPVKDPDSLVRLRNAGRNDMVTSSSDYGFTAKTADGQNVRSTFSYAMYQQFVADNRTMSDLFACAPYGRVTVVVDGQAEIATAFISTGNYYRLLGITARVGRTILPDDDTHPTLGFIHRAAASLQLQDSVVCRSVHRFTCPASSFVSRSWISVASTARV